MLLLSGTIWLQRNSQTRSKPFRRRPSASFTLVHTTCHIQAPSSKLTCPPCQTAGINLPENYLNPQSSLHSPYITFFPLRGNIHLSLDYESPQNFLASPPEPKNTNNSSHMLSPTIWLHNVFFPLYLLFFLCLFLCLLLLLLLASGYYFQ